MKKLISFIFITIFLLSMPISAFAGSIPEDLLHSDDAQIFFAEVVYYHPDKEKPDIELSPIFVIKGDVKTGGKLTYYNPNTVGNFKVKEGNVYLFTYFDEHNPTDIFEVENSQISGIKLKNIQGDMWERFEKYLNEGKYFEAEQERRQRLGLPLMIDNPLAMGRLPFLEKPHLGKIFYIVLFVIVFTLVFTITRYLVSKKKDK
ncbi:MAG: hypothetical protein IKZ35_04795 [Clostridia bacterium]|nr:hypothetical protein [Clostridia bacterium]